MTIESENLTAHQAKKLLAQFLEEMEMPYTKLTAQTVGFVDLARTSCIFVMIHGWKPHPAASAIKEFARQHHFCVEFG